MKSYLFCVALCLLGAESSILPERLAQYVCKKSSPNYQACFRQSLEYLRPYFMKGIPELQFEGLDPITIQSVKLQKTVGFGTDATVIFFNGTTTGLSNAIIQDLVANSTTLFGQIRFVIPSITINTQMNMSGNVMWAPVTIIGTFQGNFTDIKLQMNFKFYKHKNNGQWYFGLDANNIKTMIEIGSRRVAVKANDSKMQGSADFLANWYNNNVKSTDALMNPIFQDQLNIFVEHVVGQYISQVPAAELLPE